MSLLDRIHGTYVHQRRVRVLGSHLQALIPPGPGTVLDVGCGDGLLASRLRENRPELTISGIDVLVRPNTHIPVVAFDGRQIPAPDKSATTVLFVDVLHHTEDPLVLLREAARVARSAVLIKDHSLRGPAARATLRFMDGVGNTRHGVALPHNYQSWPQWESLFRSAGLRLSRCETRLGLYPWWAAWIFERKLHFVARLDPAPVAGIDHEAA